MLWLKHSLFTRLAGVQPPRQDASVAPRREHIYVDASFSCAASGDSNGAGGIGVWVPRLRFAMALKVEARSSMEAETLALLAGAMVARRLGIHRPVIFSDCKTVVRTATKHLNIARTQGLRRKLGRMLHLSGEHRAFRHIYGALHGLQGALAWQPREQNREADLASCIGSRVGNMGILLSAAKNHNHALNDVLSLATREMAAGVGHELGDRDFIHRHYRGGTRTVRWPSKQAMASRSFHRQAKLLMANISVDVA